MRKIEINYDLMTEIALAKTGFSLKKTGKTILGYTTFVSSIFSVVHIANSNPEKIPMEFVETFLLYVFFFGLTDGLLSGIRKPKSIKHLKELSSVLRSIDVGVSYESLLNANRYQTDYEFVSNDKKIPALVEKKYISVPVCDNGKDDEISLLQEHVVGTNSYSISCGEPPKVFKYRPAYGDA